MYRRIHRKGVASARRSDREAVLRRTAAAFPSSGKVAAKGECDGIAHRLRTACLCRHVHQQKVQNPEEKSPANGTRCEYSCPFLRPTSDRSEFSLRPRSCSGGAKRTRPGAQSALT